MTAPNVKISLRKTGKINVSTVYFDITFKDKRKRFSTGIRLTNGLIKNNRISSGSFDQVGDNLLLSNWSKKIDEAFQLSRTLDGDYNWEKFIRNVELTLDLINNSSIHDFNIISKFKEFIEYKKNTEKLTYSTIQTYNSTLSHLKDFQNIKGVTYSIESFSKRDIEKFIEYLRIKGLNWNTISKYIKNIKAFYRWMYSSGLIEDIRMIKMISVRKKKKIYPTLTTDEINRLWNVKLNTKNQEKYRDLFLILCYTGLRVSELIQINENTTNSDLSILTYKNAKTDEIHSKYLATPIRDLVDCYFIQSETTINHQRFNKIIKVVCKLACIDDKISVDENEKGTIKAKPKRKYELITTHTGRRTFCTLIAGDKNISISDAIELSGHKSIQMFERYVNNNTTVVIKKHSKNLDKLFRV